MKYANTFIILLFVSSSAQAQGVSGVWDEYLDRQARASSPQRVASRSPRPDVQVRSPGPGIGSSAEQGRTSGVSVELPPGASGPYRFDSLATPGAAQKPADFFEPGAVKQAAPARAVAKELEAARIIARVGDQVILAGDLLGQVNQFLHQRLQAIPPEQRSQVTEEILDQQRSQAMRQMLPQAIDSKLIYLDFLASIPKDKLPEIEDNLYQAFDEKQLPLVIEKANVQTAADLDQLLRSFGSSLEQQRRSFAEQVAAAQWRKRNASDSKEISHDDLLNFYREHSDEYEIVAKVRWEQLTSRFDKFVTEEEAWQAITKMGNEVIHGAPLDAVAKRSSHGPTAQEGGVYDWTTKGSLRSEKLNEALFTLPIGRLSQRLRDEDGFHIVRVIQRQDASMVPFSTAQTTIREKIKKQRAEAALQQYVAKLREKTPVWTIFDE